MTIALEELLKMSPEEIWARNERPTAEQLRNKEQTYYEDVTEGMELPKYIYRPTPTHGTGMRTLQKPPSTGR